MERIMIFVGWIHQMTDWLIFNKLISHLMSRVSGVRMYIL